LIALAIFLIVLISFYSLTVSAAWVLLYILVLLLFAQGLGWIVATLQVFLRDTIQALQVILPLWLYFTPIFYTMSMVDRAPKAIRVLARMNPMAIIVTGYRNSLLHVAQPSGLAIGAVMLVSMAVFIVGAFIFRQAKPSFADVL
jgi:ABC-type polysaccharide/polyol phosphate export permease